MRIDRCTCFDISFDVLQSVADAAQVQTLRELQEHVRFGLRCRLCHPYVRRMLRTGQTRFDRIVTDEEEPPRTPPAPGEY